MSETSGKTADMRMYKSILIVEDDYFLLHTLENILRTKDRRIILSSNLESAYQKLAQTSPDLIILDRCLPDGDGVELLGYIRADSFATKVMILSNKGEVRERITGLRFGADDYLPKPFEAEELKLKVEHLLNISRSEPNGGLTVQGAVINPQTGEVVKAGEIASLRRREMQILAIMARRKNQVVSRQSLIREIWGTQAEPSVATLDVYVRRLRQALHGLLEIKTMRGFGYLLAD